MIKAAPEQEESSREGPTQRQEQTRQAKAYLLESLSIDNRDPITLLECGNLFYCAKNNVLAESFFLKALEVDSTYLNAIRTYAKFISKIHSPNQAKPFYTRMNELIKRLSQSKSITTHSGDIIDFSSPEDMANSTF